MHERFEDTLSNTQGVKYVFEWSTALNSICKLHSCRKSITIGTVGTLLQLFFFLYYSLNALNKKCVCMCVFERERQRLAPLSILSHRVLLTQTKPPAHWNRNSTGKKVLTGWIDRKLLNHLTAQIDLDFWGFFNRMIKIATEDQSAVQHWAKKWW